MPSRPISPSSPPPTTSLKSKVLFIVITTSATCVIILTLLYIIYHFWHSTFSIFSTTIKRSHTSTSPFDSLHPSLTKFTYRQLKSATNHFSPDNYIGKGGSGSVFRGILRNGKSVAVKKIDFIDPITSLQSEREFQNELTILGSGIRSDHVVSLLGYCFEKDKRILVYEYMPNKSLQELLFSEEQQQQQQEEGNSVGVLGWDRRFKIMQDVALALEFLHNQCDPPVIHGDVKPSNVLLDWDLRAKLSDFGLSRVKLEEEGQEIGIGCRSRDLVWKSQDLSGNLNLSVAGGETPLSQDLSGNLVPGSSNGGGGNVDLSLAPLQASSTNNNGSRGNILIPKGKEAVMMRRGGGAEYREELELELNPSTLPAAADRRSVKTKQYLGRDWWWKQDGMSEEVVMSSSKDYVMEWIGCQIVPTNCSPDSDWVDHPAISSPMTVDNNSSLHKNDEPDRHQDHLKEEECCQSEEECEPAGYIKDGGGLIDDKESSKVGSKKEPKQMQEWWKEENLQEMTNSKKGSKRRSLESKLNQKRRRCNRALYIHHLSRCLLTKWWRCRNRTKSDRINCDLTSSGGAGAGAGEFSFFTFKRGWRRKKQQQHKRAASNVCSDMWSGDLLSRELSSTTSMRGTLCYVAPEYGGGGCGYLMEKTDIYSLGVLILVIVSGRRPLHVLNSPMELEKANLVSYCRHLAQVGNGNVLELVDDKLREVYDKEQATVCINLALACLQRMPELRPEIGDVVRVLRGEMDLPPPPFEFSPSPPSKMMSSTSRSRRKKQKMDVVEQS